MKKDEMGLELTVKPCEIIISINMGLLGAIGVVSIFSAYLKTMSLIVLIIAIFQILIGCCIAYKLREDILELNQRMLGEKAEFGDEHLKKIIDKTPDLMKLSPTLFIQEMKNLKEEEIKELQIINKKINMSYKKFFKRMDILKIWTICTLVMISLFILVEVYNGIKENLVVFFENRNIYP